MKATTKSRTLLLGTLMAMLTSTAVAQSYFDDDIYYDAKKAKKEKAEKARKAAEKAAEERAAQEARDRYLENLVDTEAGSDRAVDEYNRRSGYTPIEEPTTDLGENFKYTRRIEQFSNPGIVADSDDDDLKYYYTYANDELAGSTGTSSPTTINIYVDNIDPWDNFWSPYYYTSAWSWAWRPSYYNPWWGYNYWNYGPGWSWSWGYDPFWGPSWSWGWHYGPSWSWGWCPPYPPHYHPDVPRPSYRPSGAGGPGFSGTHGRRPASSGSTAGRRPAGTHSAVSGGTAGRRPASAGTVSSGAGRRPSQGTSVYNPSNATRHSKSGSGPAYQNGSRRASSSSSSSSNWRTSTSDRSYNREQRSSSSSGSSYNRGSSSGSSRSSSGAGFNSGRRSSGGSSSSGHSGGRGRR